MPETEEPSLVENEQAASATEAPPAVPEPALEPVPEPPLESAPAVPEKEEFDRLLNSYSQFSQPPLGSLLRGHVVKIQGGEVIVDVGYKCEGVIPAAEFIDKDGNLLLHPGDEIEVMMESAQEREGYVVLSRERAKKLKVWDDIEQAYERQSVIPGTVLERIKGGLAVDIGVRAFLPGSQVDVKPLRNIDSLIGQEISCKIIKLNKKRSNIVVSRKAVLEEDSVRLKGQTLDQLSEGTVVTGTVKNITEYGAFVDLGGIDGLLHVTDMSWGRVAHPSEIVKVGDELQVKILKLDKEKERVSLGLKQLGEDPWATVAEKFPVGARVNGKVLNFTDYGAFVELDQGIEGLIHVSEMSWSKRVKHPSKIVSPGAMVETMVLEVHPQERRISLGLKQCEANPWETLSERYAKGTIVKGRVRNLTDFGAFVEVEEGIDGLVHVSDISWTKRIKHPSEALKKGEIVQAMVLNIDPENRRLSLGIKQLQKDAWETFCERFHLGDTIHGKVMRKATFGVFVELVEGIEGLCHISEFGTEGPDRHAVPMEPGQESEFKIIKIAAEERKVGLSVKALQPPVERKEERKEERQDDRKTERKGERKSERRGERRDAEKFAPSSSSSNATATNTIGDMVAMKERNASKR